VLAFDDVDTQTPTQSITPCDQTGALNTIRGSRLPCTKIKKFDGFFITMSDTSKYKSAPGT
jgi:hypothetical protein